MAYDFADRGKIAFLIRLFLSLGCWSCSRNFISFELPGLSEMDTMMPVCMHISFNPIERVVSGIEFSKAKFYSSLPGAFWEIESSDSICRLGESIEMSLSKSAIRRLSK